MQARDFFNAANSFAELKDDDLAKVTGGSFESELNDLRLQVFEILNEFFNLPQTTIDYINTTTNVEALYTLGIRTNVHSAKSDSSAAYGFESACQQFGIPYAGYKVK